MDEKENLDATRTTEPPSVHAGAAELMELREQRASEYLSAALRTEDTLAANVGAINADLMFFAHHARRMIEPALKMAPAELEAFQHLYPALQAHARLAREIGRLSALDVKIRQKHEKEP